MTGSLSIFDALPGLVDSFNEGGFVGNDWVSDLNVATDENSMTLAPQGVYDSGYFTGQMDEQQNYEIPSINATATPYSGMDEEQNYAIPDGLSLFNLNQQINPAGTSSEDGMMTMPTNYLYPGEAIGIDGVPYRPNAGASTASSGGGGGGGASAYSAPEAEAAYLSQDLSQRTPSGTQYAPDMSAYNDSSLFNYTGPGGVDGYTYGQGLRTDGADYSMFGTPTDMVNPYYEGQFADPVSTGVADSAVGMSPIVMPEGIPAIIKQKRLFGYSRSRIKS